MTGEIYLIAFAVASVLTAIILMWFLRTDSILLTGDMPSSRGLHQRVVPRGGGLAILAGVAVVGMLGHLQGIRNVELTLVTVASLIGVGVMGFLDDRFNLGVGLRLFAGLALTTLLVLGSLGDHPILLFGQGYDWPLWVLMLIGALAIFWLMNLFNFMDGADGVAGVQGLVASSVLAIWFASTGQEFLVLVNVALAGACFGFLWFNWSPARVFLGDVGSLALGAWFGVTSLIGVTRYGLPLEAFLILLAVFVFDATLTLVQRLLQGKPVIQAHREHLYQKLILAGWSHRNVSVLVGIMALFAALLATMTVWSPDHGLWFFLVTLVMLLGYAMLAMRAGARIPERTEN